MRHHPDDVDVAVFRQNVAGSLVELFRIYIGDASHGFLVNSGDDLVVASPSRSFRFAGCRKNPPER
jgi:hypothetical protein